MKKLYVIIVMAMGISLGSCGEGKEEKEQITIGEDNRLETVDTEAASEDTEESAKEAVTRKDGVVEIRLTGDDQMRFNLKEIRVKAGETVKLTLEHIGELPENAMGHNFVLLEQGTDVPAFAQKANQASGTDYVPENSEQVIIHTEMIGGGEQTSIEFEAPEKGTYTFICSFPGHYIQMQGEFIVE